MNRTTGKSRLRAGLLLAAFGAIAVPVGVTARAETSQSDKDACTPDVWRLCAGQIPNVGEIVACLNRKMNKLSPECRGVMQGGGERTARRSRRGE